MQEQTVTWVAYLMTIRGRADKMRAVCKQSEWNAMELDRPGYHQLIRGDIASEAEAEMLARKDPSAGISVPISI
jgi:hypothetical protein